jgi:hypothetical protein
MSIESCNSIFFNIKQAVPLIMEVFVNLFINKWSSVGQWWITSSVFGRYLIYFVASTMCEPGSVFGIVSGYGLGNQEVRIRVPVGSRIFSSPHCPDRLWGVPRLLSNGYQGLFPRGYSGWSVNMTAHLQLVPRSRKCGSIYPLLHMPSWCSS